MAEKIKLIVQGPGDYQLDDPSAELVNGLAVSHKYRMAFGQGYRVPFYQPREWGKSPPQTSTAWMVELDEIEREIEQAIRQYGWTRFDRWVRFLVMGPFGSVAGLVTAILALSIGYWPIIKTVHREDALLALVFLLPWSTFFVTVVARSVVNVWPRQWAIGLFAGIAL